MQLLYGFRDNRFAQIALGLVLPGLLLGVITFNLIFGRVLFVWMPEDDPLTVVRWFNGGAEIAGIVFAKSGLAVILFAWCWLANRQREQWTEMAQPGAMVGLSLTALGLALFAWGTIS